MYLSSLECGTMSQSSPFASSSDTASHSLGVALHSGSGGLCIVPMKPPWRTIYSRNLRRKQDSSRSGNTANASQRLVRSMLLPQLLTLWEIYALWLRQGFGGSRWVGLAANLSFHFVRPTIGGRSIHPLLSPFYNNVACLPVQG